MILLKASPVITKEHCSCSIFVAAVDCRNVDIYTKVSDFQLIEKDILHHFLQLTEVQPCAAKPLK